NPIAESPIIKSPMIKNLITRSPMIKSPIVKSPIKETQTEEIHLIEDQEESSFLQNTLRKCKSRKIKYQKNMKHILDMSEKK
ncbi:5467_t:CDS:1, partial [Gigaspora margarita]